MSAGDFIPFRVNRTAAPRDLAGCSRTAAGPAATDDGFGDWGKGADFRHFQRERERPVQIVAAVAAVAAPPPCSRPWAGGIRELRTLPTPPFIMPDAWDHLVFVALRLDEQWGEQAHSLGWSAIDLFGTNPDPRAYRSDQCGLARLLSRWAGPIQATGVTADCITLEAIHGSVLRYRRFEMDGAVPLWVAFSDESGP